jgi:hypothetical protein
MIMLIDAVRYRLVTPETEASLEEAVKSNCEHMFGPNSFYFDIKKVIRSRAGVASIPDGYVIYFAPKAKWAIVEVELASHPIYDHLIPQLSKFNTGVEHSSTRKQLAQIFHDMFNQDKVLKARLKHRIKTGEVYKFISDLVSERPTIVVVIDKKTDELVEALSDIRGDIRVIEFRTFRREGVSGHVNAFAFEPIYCAPVVDSRDYPQTLSGSDASHTTKTRIRPSTQSTNDASYSAKYGKQLDNPNSMAMKIARYVQEKGQVTFKDLKDVIANDWGYKISGSIGACLFVLKERDYIQIEGRGDDKVIMATKR